MVEVVGGREWRVVMGETVSGGTGAGGGGGGEKWW